MPTPRHSNRTIRHQPPERDNRTALGFATKSGKTSCHRGRKFRQRAAQEARSPSKIFEGIPSLITIDHILTRNARAKS